MSALLKELRSRGILTEDDERQLRDELAPELGELRGELGKMREQVAFLNGRQEQGAAAKPGAVENFFKAVDDTSLPEGVDPGGMRALKGMLQEFYGAIKEDMGGELREQLLPTQRLASQSAAERMVDRYFDENILPAYGPDVKALWGPVRAKAVRGVMDGEKGVNPEALLLAHDREKALALASKVAASKQSGAGDSHLEGLTQHWRKQPASSVARALPAAAHEPALAPGGEPDKPLDWEAEGEDVVSKIQAARTGGVAAAAV
jgi:hypothetical protein